MAEVLSVVSSGIAVAGLAGSLAKSTTALKKLWDQFQNVPESIQGHLEQLELFPPLIADIEASFRESPAAYASTGAAEKCMKFCKKTLDVLNAIVVDLQKDLESSSKVKRSKAKMRGVLKAGAMQQYRERLNMAIQMLVSCQLTYQSSLIRLQPRLVAAELEVIQKQPAPKIKWNTGSSPQDIDTKMRSLLKWQPPSLFGSVGYAHNTIASKHETHQVSQVRMQLPWWLAGKTWDLYMDRACSGWKIAIRAIAIFEDMSVFVEIIKTGSSCDLFKALSQRGHSIHDRNLDGETILHAALDSSRFDMALDLVEAGASLAEPDIFGDSPFMYACDMGKNWIRFYLPDHSTSANKASRLRFFQQLAHRERLEELVESSKVRYAPLNAFEYVMWSDGNVLDFARSTLSLELRTPAVQNIPWHYICSSTLLELLKPLGFPDLGEVVKSHATMLPIDIPQFAVRYFKEMAYSAFPDTDNKTDQDDWRAIFRAVLARVPVAKLTIEDHASILLQELNDIDAITNKLSQVETRTCQQKVLFCWLEDLQTCGVDLEEYGRDQKSRLDISNHSLSPSVYIHRRLIIRPSQVLDLDYGPNPEDWRLYWDIFGPEEECFWQDLKPSKPPVPGSWVD